jgi:hypothetical protein
MEQEVRKFQEYPQPQSSRLVDFERAEVRVLESDPPRYQLVVSGTKPCANMRVELLPLVYVRQPEYWGIEVVGCLPGGICLTALAPYAVELLDPPIGTRGIEVMGATRSKTIDIPLVDQKPQGSFDLSIASAASGQVLASASLTCNPDGGSHPNPATACEQLTQANGFIEKIPPEEGACTREFKPVILKASGTWDGEDRQFEFEFSNRCVGVKETGGEIFDFKVSEG